MVPYADSIAANDALVATARSARSALEYVHVVCECGSGGCGERLHVRVGDLVEARKLGFLIVAPGHAHEQRLETAVMNATFDLARQPA